jgi:hypothetical protein
MGASLVPHPRAGRKARGNRVGILRVHRREERFNPIWKLGIVHHILSSNAADMALTVCP